MNSRKLILTLALAAAAGLSAVAGDIEWPTDFWQQVANHVTAVAPAGGQVATSSEKSDWEFAAMCMEIVYGTYLNPLDTRLLLEATSDETVVSSLPGGAILIVR